MIGARGKALAEFTPLDFQDIIVEDISETALGHMNKGLMTAHGWDEGGKEGSGLGGHDAMWFVLRDLILGKDKFPLATSAESIGRVKQGRETEAVPVEHETLISFLMDLLMMEVRAERALRFDESVIGNADVFLDKQEEVKHGVMMVNRIRMDENIHVAWLKVAISEFRNFTIKKNDGTQVKGPTLLDPIWEKMVRWHAVEMQEANRDNNHAEMDYEIIEAFKKLAA